MSIYGTQSQRDSRWASVQLGSTPGATIGAYGCFITCAAMMATHYTGQLVNPPQINLELLNRGLYQNGDLYPDGALTKLVAGVQMEGAYPYVNVPADLTKLQMNDQEEVLLVLDFDHNPNDGIQVHAVRAYAWDGHTLIIDDPWYGSRDNFSLHYGTNPAQTIVKIIRYTKPDFVPPWKPAPKPVDPCAAVTAERDALKKTAADLAAQLSVERFKLQTIAAWIKAVPNV